MTESLAIGIDIGGTGTAFGIVNRRGQILEQAHMPTTGFDTVHAFVKALQTQMQPIVDSYASSHHIVGCGIGAPNGNFYTGEIAYAPNLPWEGIIPLAKLFSDALKLKVVITNDANAAAIGEMMYGAAKGMKDFVMVTLGTGIGSGFVANGQMIYGHDGFAGELGHVIAVRDGRMCGCGRKGCLERYASATGIAFTAKEWLENKNEDSLLRNIKEPITSKHIHEAAEQGDQLALELFDYTGKILGQTLADVVAITSPQAFIFFGGLANAGEMLFAPVRKYMEANLLRVYKNKVALISSALSDADAAILGASALVW